MTRRSRLAVVLVVALWVPAAPATAAQLPRPDREALVRAVAQRRPSISLMIASRAGANGAVADGLRSLGATIAYRDDDVGYLRADVPAGRALAATALSGVLAVNVDQAQPQLGSAPPDETGLPIPGADTPAVNPYVPVGDIGAPQFVAAHPTWDGRGTTLGVIDDGVDVLTPELRTGRLADGTVVDKLVDYISVTHPVIDPTWVDMSAQVTARAGTIAFAGETYVAPVAKGTFRIGRFDERVGYPLEDGDVNRDGNPPGSSGLFAVLWDADTNRVWVDTDQDHSFADQRALTDYRVAHDSDTFGTDDPATAVRETVPFVVQTDSPRKLVNINVEASEGHGTAVSSVAVGSGFFGSRAVGAAPGARLAVARTDLFPSSDTEAALYLVKRDKADALNLSYGGAAGSTNNVEGIVLGRIVDQYGIQVFAAAGNDRMTLSTVSQPGTTLNVVSVAASATRATTRAVSGYDMSAGEDVEWYSSRGPSIDGALKPDLAAPGMTWTSLPGWRDPGLFAPAGYQRSRGTSFATPIAAGGALLLLSAARQSHVSARADQLRLALYSSARRLAAASTHAQGRGVMSVPGAWDLLRRNLQTVSIQASGPVDDGWTRDAGLPPVGPGLFEHEGWTAGQAGTRTLTLTRTTGPTAAVTYQLSLTGDDGTFGVPPTVTLAKGTARAVSVSIHPAGFGVHAAILNVDDPTTPGVDAQVGLTVAAAERYDDGNQFRIAHAGSVGNDQIADFLFTMPADAVRWTAALTSAGALSWSISDPLFPVETHRLPEHPGGVVYDTTLDNSLGRVWEYGISTAFQRSATTPYELRTNVIGRVSVSPSPLVIDPASVGTTFSRTLSFATGSVGFEGHASGTDLGPVDATRAAINEAGYFYRDVNVAPTASHLALTIGHSSSAADDLDLYLQHCDDPDCTTGPIYRSVTTGSDERIDVDHPQPGRWTAIVIPRLPPTGPIEFDFASVIGDAAYGSVTVDDTDAFHPSGDHWTRDVRVRPLAAPAAGVPLRGFVHVSSTWSDVELRNLTTP